MKPAHWTEFHSDTRANFRRVCLRMCFKCTAHSLENLGKSCFPLRPQLGYAVHITGKKLVIMKTPQKTFKGLQISTSPILV